MKVSNRIVNRCNMIAFLAAGFCAVPVALQAAPISFNSSSALVSAEADEYTNVGEISARIPRGLSTWTLKSETAIEAGQISIWHRTEAGCRGFNIAGVKTKAATDGAEWRALQGTNWEGVTHFKANEAFNELEVTVSSQRLITMECLIVVRKANFTIPDVVTLLAKINPPACDDTDTPVCTYTAERIDNAERPTLTLTHEDFEKYNLEANAIYKFKGYDLQTDGGAVFRLLSSQKVMQ